MVGTIDTTTAGGVDINQASPIFVHARKDELATAMRALDPDDTEVSQSSVVLSPFETDPDSIDTVRGRLKEAHAAAVAKSDDVGSPLVVDGKKAQEEREKAEKEGKGKGDPVSGSTLGTLDTSGTSQDGPPNTDALTPRHGEEDAGLVVNSSPPVSVIPGDEAAVRAEHAARAAKKR